MDKTGRQQWARRRFLKCLAGSAAAAVGPVVVPAWALGRGGRAGPPGERIAVGFIGVGAMGRVHLRSLLEYKQTQVLAVCDVDRWRRQHAQATTEEVYGGRRKSGSYRCCRAYNDLRELLARDDIDAVVIATGDRWHAAATVLAAEAGKDIYCEKPLSLTVHEGQAMVRAVRRCGRIFQTGLQQRSTPEFRRACRLVRHGRLGKITRVYVNFPGTSEAVNLAAEPVPDGLDWDLWLGPAPWRPFNHRFHHYGKPIRVVPWDFCRDFGGGNLTSNAVHAFDTVQWALGMDESGPVEVIPPETGQFPVLTYRYANGVLLQVDWKLDSQKHFVPKGWDPKTPLQSFGALFVGEDGWIHVGRAGYLRSFPASIVAEPAADEEEHPVNNHHQNWLECIRTRQRPVCDVAVGFHSTTVAHLGCIAHWTGRALRWDPARLRFIGDEDANRLLGRALRPPWRV